MIRRAYWIGFIPFVAFVIAWRFFSFDIARDEKKTAWQIYWLNNTPPDRPDAPGVWDGEAMHREFLAEHPEFREDPTPRLIASCTAAIAGYALVGLMIGLVKREPPKLEG